MVCASALLGRFRPGSSFLVALARQGEAEDIEKIGHSNHRTELSGFSMFHVAESDPSTGTVQPTSTSRYMRNSDPLRSTPYRRRSCHRRHQEACRYMINK